MTCIIYCANAYGYHDDSEIIGTFDSREKAEQCLKLMGFKYDRNFPGWHRKFRTFGEYKEEKEAWIMEYPTNHFRAPCVRSRYCEPEWRELL